MLSKPVGVFGWTAIDRSKCRRHRPKASGWRAASKRSASTRPFPSSKASALHLQQHVTGPQTTLFRQVIVTLTLTRANRADAVCILLYDSLGGRQYTVARLGLRLRRLILGSESSCNRLICPQIELSEGLYKSGLVKMFMCFGTSDTAAKIGPRYSQRYSPLGESPSPCLSDRRLTRRRRSVVWVTVEVVTIKTCRTHRLQRASPY